MINLLQILICLLFQYSCVAPMHYWSKEYKDSLLHDLASMKRELEYEVVDISDEPIYIDDAVID